jgi:hypothetical protein
VLLLVYSDSEMLLINIIIGVPLILESFLLSHFIGAIGCIVAVKQVSRVHRSYACSAEVWGASSVHFLFLFLFFITYE